MAQRANYSGNYYDNLIKQFNGDKKKATAHLQKVSDSDLNKKYVNKNEVLKRLGAPSRSPTPVKTAAALKNNNSFLKNFTKTAKPYIAKAGTLVGKTIDTINKPLYGTANVFKNLAQTDKKGNSVKFQPLKSFKEGWSGKAKTTFSDFYNTVDEGYKKRGEKLPVRFDPISLLTDGIGKAMGKTPEQSRKASNFIFGLGADMLTLPTGVGIGGLTKTGKVAEIPQKGQTVKGGSPLDKMIKQVSLKNPQAAAFGATKAEQAARGQRSLLGYFGQSVVPTKVNAAAFKALEKTGKAGAGLIKSQPWMLAGSRMFAKDFSMSEQGRAARQLATEAEARERLAKVDALKNARELRKEQQTLGYDDPSVLMDRAEKLKVGKEAKFNIARNSGLNAKKINITDPNYKLDKAIKAIKAPTLAARAKSRSSNPDVYGIANQAAKAKGFNLEQLMDDAVKHPSQKQYLDSIKDNAYWKRVTGLTPLKAAASANRTGIPVGEQAAKQGSPVADVFNRIKAAPGTYRGQSKEFAGLPEAERNYLSKLHQMNKEMLESEQKAGVNISHLTDPKLNYMPHVLEPELQKKFGKKAYNSKLTAPLKEWLHEHGGVFFGKSGNSILSPNAIERKYNMPVSEINSLAKAGNLFEEGSKNAGQKFEKFLVNDPSKAMAKRMMNSAQVVERAKFLDDAARQFGKQSTPELVAQGYRKIQSAQFGDKLDGLLFEKDVARMVEKAIKPLTSPEEAAKLHHLALNVFDKMQGLWKMTNLVLVPAYHARNFMGNIWMNFLGDVNPANYTKGIKMVFNQGGKGEIKTAAGHTFTEDEVYRMAQEQGVTDTGFWRTEMMRGENPLQEKGLKHYLNPINAGNKAQEVVENTARMTHFVDKIERGYSPQMAAESVKKFLYSYDNLTDFETGVMRRAFPFYAWSRHNIPLQLKTLFTQPGKPAVQAKLEQNIENYYENAEGGRPNERWMQPYLKESNPVYMGMDDDGTGRYFQTKFWAPFSDIQDLEKMVTRQGILPEWVAENATPFVKIPFDIHYNEQSYFETPISRTDPELVGEEYTNFLGVEMPKKAAYGLQSFARPLNEVNKLNPGGVFGKKLNELDQNSRLLNFMAGLRYQTYNPQEQAGFYNNNMQNQLNTLKHLYERAQMENNTKRMKMIQEKAAALENDPRTKELYNDYTMYYRK
jgi:hypothetical protein